MGLGSAIKYGVSWCAPWAIVVRGQRFSPPAVAITFDDGPHPENTPLILDVLSAQQVRASFFLQGDMAVRYPLLVREIVNRGHQIGNHGYSHIDAKTVPTRLYVDDVLRAQNALEDIVGTELPRLFRPPFGSITAGSFIALLRERFRFVLWSIDSQDSFLSDAVALCGKIAGTQLPAGSILLFHDDYMHTAEALPNIIGDVKNRGLSLISVDDFL